MWGVTNTRKSDKIDFDDLEIEIDWKRVDIFQADANFENRNLKGDIKAQTLFKTYFTNKTNTEQEYSFQTERTTRQSCTFTFIKGFSREKEGKNLLKSQIRFYLFF
jgi:hypothetical protein